MTLQAPTQASTAKRKQPAEGPAGSRKKHRGDGSATATATTAGPQAPPESHTLRVVSPVLERLKDKYDVKALSVLSSTSMNKRVAAVLAHLGQFHPWDRAVKPGVVLLYARAPAAGKMLGVAELVKRRVGEMEQKWWQYNKLDEFELPADDATVAAAAGDDGDASVDEVTEMVEDTVMEGDDHDEEDYFETMGDNADHGRESTLAEPTPFERAVGIDRPRTRLQLAVSVVLSRVPVPELRATAEVTEQTNDSTIEHLRRRKMGLA